MKRNNALVGLEVVEHFKKCKMSTQDFILNLAKNISNYSEFETFMTSLKEYYQIKVYRTPNDECVTITVNGEIFCSLVEDRRFFNEIWRSNYFYDNYDEKFSDFLIDVYDEISCEYLDKIIIPVHADSSLEHINLLLKAYYLKPSTDNISSN